MKVNPEIKQLLIYTLASLGERWSHIIDLPAELKKIQLEDEKQFQSLTSQLLVRAKDAVREQVEMVENLKKFLSNDPRGKEFQACIDSMDTLVENVSKCFDENSISGFRSVLIKSGEMLAAQMAALDLTEMKNKKLH